MSKKCPNCSEYIPEGWNRHDKCGWNCLTGDMEKAITDSLEIMKRIQKRYPKDCIQLNLTKIALTLFIQSRKERRLYL
jgi:hypothetical protein